RSRDRDVPSLPRIVHPGDRRGRRLAPVEERREPVPPVHHPEVDGDVEVGVFDVRMTFEIGPGPGELENAVVCARRQAIAIHRQAEHRLGLWRRAAVSADEPRRHLSVAVDAWLAPESLTLSFTRRFDARAVVSARGFGLCRGSEAVPLDAPGENRDVDPIEERTAHPSVVLENAVTRADAACP